MTPFVENVIGGAALVTFIPNPGRDYDAARIAARYSRQARLRGVPFDHVLISRVHFERMLGIALMTASCVGFIVGAVLLANTHEVWACLAGICPAVLRTLVQRMEHTSEMELRDV